MDVGPLPAATVCSIRHALAARPMVSEMDLMEYFRADV